MKYSFAFRWIMILLSVITSPLLAILGLVRSYLPTCKIKLVALVFLFSGQYLSIYLNNITEIDEILRIIQFIVIISFVLLFPFSINSRIISVTQLSIVLISVFMLFLKYTGLVALVDTDLYRDTGIYVLRYPLQEPAHLAIVLGALEIKRITNGLRFRKFILLPIIFTLSVTGFVIAILLLYLYSRQLRLKSKLFHIVYITGLLVAPMMIIYPNIEHRFNSISEGSDVSILRRTVYSLEAVQSLSGGQIIYGKGHGKGIVIDTLIYKNENFIPNNLIAAVYVQYGMLGCIFVLMMIIAYWKSKSNILMILFLPNAYLFTSVAILLHVLINSKFTNEKI